MEKDSIKGLAVLGLIAAVACVAFQGMTSAPTPVPDPIPAIESDISKAAAAAIRTYAGDVMAVNHRRAAEMIRDGELSSLDEAHDWMAERNAIGRKQAFHALGTLFNSVEQTPEAAAKALDEAADGYERATHAIK